MLLDNGKRRNHRIGGGSRPHPRGQKVKGSSRRATPLLAQVFHLD